MSNKVIRDVFICNPITREYIKLPPPVNFTSVHEVFGFGVSKRTGKYKVVRVFKDDDSSFEPSSWGQDQFKCEIYTLGTGSWRSAEAPGGPIWFSVASLGLFLNGNIHWLVQCFGEGSSRWIACFDLETECFSTFSIPNDGHPYFGGRRTLCTLGDSLCLCCSDVDVVEIWLMNKYGDDESWRKEFVIKKPSYSGIVVPIKMFKNGDIMFASQRRLKLYCYSRETKTIREVDQTKGFADCGFKPMIYVPSLFPLKTFAMENVSSY